MAPLRGLESLIAAIPLCSKVNHIRCDRCRISSTAHDVATVLIGENVYNVRFLCHINLLSGNVEHFRGRIVDLDGKIPEHQTELPSPAGRP